MTWLRLLAGLLVSVTISLAAVPLDVQDRLFVSADRTTVVSHDRILSFSHETRSARIIALDETRAVDEIVDAVENDGLLWVVANNSLYSLNLETSTVERIDAPEHSFCSGTVAADYDYVWIFCGNLLARFDKLGREWMTFPVEPAPPAGSAILGALSDEDNVYCVSTDGTRIFSVYDEKWTSQLLADAPFSPVARCAPVADEIDVVDGARMARFLTGNRSWEVTALTSSVRYAVHGAAMADGTNSYLLSESSLSAFDAATSIVKPVSVPRLHGARVMCKVSDTLIAVATENELLLFDTKNEVAQPFVYQRATWGAELRAVFAVDTRIALVGEHFVATYDPNTGLWESQNLDAGAAVGRRIAWNDDGLKANYARGVSSTLRGEVAWDARYRTQDGKNRYGYNTLYEHDTLGHFVDDTVSGGKYFHPDTIVVSDSSVDSVLLLYRKVADPRASLTLHNTLGSGRYLDLYFDNKLISQPVKRGARYRGIRGDIVQSATLGRSPTAPSQSLLLPVTTLDGVQVEMEGHKTLEQRDRRMLRGSFGAGYELTKTVRLTIPYASSGNYQVVAEGGTTPVRVVPGTFALWADGEKVDSTSYTFVSTTGELFFKRDDVVDPSSVITVMYQVETVPNGALNKVTPLPENHYGPRGFADVTVSPKEWISANLTYVPMRTDSGDIHIVRGSVPIEVRTKNLFLHAEPEAAVQAENGNAAGGLQVRSRVGKKTSLQLETMIADSEFVSTDDIGRGFGAVRKNFDVSLKREIVDNLTIGYKQRNTRASLGQEDRYEVNAALQMARIPYVDFELSRTIRDAAVSTPGIDSLFDVDAFGDPETTLVTVFGADTVNGVKDRAQVRVYETSSAFLQQLTRFRRIAYEAAYTRYLYDDHIADVESDGQTLFGSVVLSPVNAVTVSGEATWRDNPGTARYAMQLDPTLQFQTLDFPPGIDISGAYQFNFSRDSLGDSSGETLSRSLLGVMRPGRWFPVLNWLSPRFGLRQNISTRFDTGDPSTADILLAANDRTAWTLTKSAGLHVFPADFILLRTQNDWTSGSGAPQFKTFNDAKFWFNDKKGLWQTRWELGTDRALYYHHRGYTRLDNQWRPWIATKTGINATYDLDTVSEGGDMRDFSIGPTVQISLSAFNLSLLRMLLNNHLIGLTWNRVDGELVSRKPDLYYDMYLKLVVKPQISGELKGTIDLTPELSSQGYSLGAFSFSLKLQTVF